MMINVKDQNPGIVAELMKIAEEASLDLGDGIMNVKGANVREPGRTEEEK